MVNKMPVTVNGNTFETYEDTWNDPNYLSAEEKAIIDFRIELFTALVEARQKQGLSQKQLSEKATLTQPEIARLEKANKNPRIDTLLRATVPLGYKLKLERIE
jgi:ribosome-binding protein aMBF1 (putative translation factor)